MVKSLLLLCLLSVFILASFRIGVFFQYFIVLIDFPLRDLTQKLSTLEYECFADVAATLESSQYIPLVVQKLIERFTSFSYDREHYVRLQSEKPLVALNGANFISRLSWTRQTLELFRSGTRTTLKRSITIILASESPIEADSSEKIIFNVATDLLIESLSELSTLYSVSVNVLTKHHVGLSSSVDVLDFMTSSSTSMWSSDHCPSINDGLSCNNVFFTVYVPNGNDTSADLNDVLWLNDGSSSSGSFVVLNSSNSYLTSLYIPLDHLLTTQRKHFLSLFDIPQLMYDNTLSIDDDKLDVIVRLNDAGTHSDKVNDTLSKETKRLALLKRLYSMVEDIQRKMRVIKSVYIDHNALLWYDVITNADWVKKWKEIQFLLASFVEYSSLLERGTYDYTKQGVVHDLNDTDDDKSFDIIADSILRQMTVESKRCSEHYLMINKFNSQLTELLLKVDHLYFDTQSSYGAVISSKLPIEQYFAIFAPFWLPLVAPIVKFVKVV